MLYYGMVQKVIAPNESGNANKFQYEYLVLVKMQNFSQVPINHVVVSDEFGSMDDFSDRTLKVGQRVLVMCPLGDTTSAIIVGALRNTQIKTDPLFGHHKRSRFNRIEEIIDKDFGWSLYVKPDGTKPDDHTKIGSVGVGDKDGPKRNVNIGPGLQVNPKFIIFDDSNGQQIKFDVEAQTLTVSCNNLVINVTKNATVNVKENATVNVTKNLTATVKGEASLTVEGNLTAKVTKNANVDCDKLTAKAKSDATVEAGGKATVKGSQVILNKQMTGITTAQSHQNVIDLITGVPVIPSTTVFGDV